MTKPSASPSRERSPSTSRPHGACSAARCVLVPVIAHLPGGARVMQISPRIQLSGPDAASAGGSGVVIGREPARCFGHARGLGFLAPVWIGFVDFRRAY